MKLTRNNLFRPLVNMTCFCALAATAHTGLWGQSATVCPAYNLPGPNLALNPDFEEVGPCGASTHWVGGTGNCDVNSAAANWVVHSSNTQTAVNTYWVNTTLPIGGQKKMLRIVAKGNESGVWQPFTPPSTTVMVSAWVNVKYGHVAMQASGGQSGPTAWNDKYNEWEELRICTNGLVPIDNIILWNEDPSGADFLVDRVEAAVITPN